MRKVFLSCLFLAMATIVMALPAKRGIWRTVTLADGTKVQAELRGDEYMNFWMAKDGSKYKPAIGKDYYVKADVNALAAHAEAMRKQNPLPQRSAALPQTANGKSRVAIGGDHPDFIGSKKGLIILAEFTDKKFQPGHDAEYYSHVANDLNFSSEDGFIGSIRDYFLAQSEGQFDLTFDVVGPIALAKDMEYYGGHEGDYNDKNAGGMIREAVVGASKILSDFSPYDWFGDGYVDQVFVIYAGLGEASGGDENTIWPHRSQINTLNLGGKKVSVYACSNEMQPVYGSNEEIIDGIGAFCHEFSHCLGLPDLYDTDYTGNYGMGYWDVMDAGCYLGNSFAPCGYSGYEKNFCGWKQPVVLEGDTVITNLKGISEGGDYYIVYNDAYKNEYYVLENRNRKGWDVGQYGSGLLITHIDFNKSVWSFNQVNTGKNKRYTPFLADNNERLQYQSDVAGDLYPYKTNNQLTNTSVPAAILYNKNPDGENFMSKPITGITKNSDGTVSFTFKNEVGKTSLEPMPEGCLFRETFSRSYGAGGNDDRWWGVGVATGDFVADNEGWTSDGQKSGGSKCACFGASNSAGSATTPEIEINGETELSFLAAPWIGESSALTLAVTSGNATLGNDSFQLEKGLWNECKTVLTGEGKVKVNFKSNKGRFFLDEVYVMTKDPSGINEVKFDARPKQVRIFTIDGRYAGNDYHLLAPGIYVINGKKVVK